MSFRRVLLGVGSFLGMFLPRNDGGSSVATLPDDAAAIARAAELEAANARIRELEGLSEQKIREQAELLIHEVFPAVSVPESAPRSYVRYGEEALPESQNPPSLEEQVAHLSERVTDREIEDAANQLQARIDQGIATKYQSARKWEVMGWIAKAGDRPINIEKMLEVSHNHEESQFRERYSRERAAEANNTRQNAPPPLPTNSGGVPVPGEPKATMKTATSLLIQKMQEKMGWGKTS